MKRILIALLIPLMSIATAGEQDTLGNHRWKHRLLVIPKASGALTAALEKHRAGLDGRDVKTIMLSPGDPLPIHRQIASRFNLTADSGEILLIGKDGATTVRWPSDEFSIQSLFQRIDAMPMRRREMRTSSQPSACDLEKESGRGKRAQGS